MTDRDPMAQLKQYYAVWQQYNDQYEKWAKAHGMSVNSLLVLSAIEEGQDCTQRSISQQWMIPKQTVNMILKELERKGLVAFFPMPEDRRNKRIEFTPAGRAYAGPILSQLRTAELYAIEQMGPERMQQLNDNMALFAELFSKAGKDEKES